MVILPCLSILFSNTYIFYVFIVSFLFSIIYSFIRW